MGSSDESNSLSPAIPLRGASGQHGDALPDRLGSDQHHARHAPSMGRHSAMVLDLAARRGQIIPESAESYSGKYSLGNGYPDSFGVGGNAGANPQPTRAFRPKGATTGIMTPALTVDQALSAVTAAEATYNADAANAATASAASATADSLALAAQETVAMDAAAYNSAVDAAVAALTASKK